MKTYTFDKGIVTIHKQLNEKRLKEVTKKFAIEIEKEILCKKSQT